MAYMEKHVKYKGGSVQEQNIFDLWAGYISENAGTKYDVNMIDY